jgi:hypothetical protein
MRIASARILDGFRVGDVVTCRTDQRRPLLWKIVYVHAPNIFAGRTLHLVDLGCIDTLGSDHGQHRVGMSRSRVSTSHLSHVTEEKKEARTMGAHINEKGQWQSDKYPSTPADCVPLRVTDKTAQDLLWEYAQRRRKVDAEFSDDLESRLKTVGFESKTDSLTTKLEAALERLRTHDGWCDAIGAQPYLVNALREAKKDHDALRKLVIEIAQHFDPMFGVINLHRLDDREWMNKAAKVVGEDDIYPWKKIDRSK